MPKCKHIVDDFILQFLDYKGINGLANDIAKSRHIDCFTHYASRDIRIDSTSLRPFVLFAVEHNWAEALRVPNINHGDPNDLLVEAYNHAALECYFLLTKLYPSVFLLHVNGLEKYEKHHMEKRTMMIRHAIEHAPPSVKGGYHLFQTFHRCTRGLDVELFKLLKSKFDVGSSLGSPNLACYWNVWNRLDSPVRRYRFDTEPENRSELFKNTRREPDVYHEGELEVIVRGMRKYDQQKQFIKELRAQFALMYQQRASQDNEWAQVFKFYYFDPLSISSLCEWI